MPFGRPFCVDGVDLWADPAFVRYGRLNWLTKFRPAQDQGRCLRQGVAGESWPDMSKFANKMLFRRDWEANQEVCNHCGPSKTIGRIRPL